jgi:hypothetical protein
MLCAICTVHKKTRSVGFLVERQNQGRRVSRFGPQNRHLRFGDLGHKITTTVSWFGSQKQVRNGLSVAPQNRREEDGAGHVSRSSGLLHREVKQVGVGFPSLPQNWQRGDDGWCMSHHRGGHVKIKPKTDGSMRWAASDSSTPTLPFS